MLHLRPPSGFTAHFKVVGCLCLCDGRVLLLRRGAQRSHPEHWGSPGGKIRQGEVPVRAALRELHEETGIVLSEENLSHAHRYFITDTTFQFEYDLFIAHFDEPRDVTVNAGEHTEARWFAVHDALRLPLVPHHDAVLLDQLAHFAKEQTQFDLFGNVPTTQRRPVQDIEADIKKSFGPAGDLFASSVTQPWFVALGPPASGKSTGLRAMKQHNPRLQVLRERQLVRRNSRMNQLLQYATNVQQHHPYFHFQMAVLPLRMWQLLSGSGSMIALLDDSHFTALAYSRALYELGLLDEQEYATFFMAYHVCNQIIPAPAGVLYFECPTHVLMERIRNRAAKHGQERVHELQYSVQYIASLARSFAEVARELSLITSLVHIDTNRLRPDDIAKTFTPT